MIEKKYLNEILIMRPIIIIMLVLYHSFAFYNGSWDNPGVSPNDAYEWISHYSYACLLEAFTFVSGYVWYYQIHKKRDFTNIVKNKFKRLILPALFWGCIYYLIFFYQDSHSLVHMIKRTVIGIGHLWFLPMLFWIFIMSYFIEKIRVELGFKVVCLLLLALIPLPLIPFQITKSIYYLFFFYLGAYVYEKLKDYKWKPFHISVIALVTVSLVYLTHKYVYKDIFDGLTGNGTGVVTTIWNGGLFVRAATVIYALGGVLLIYSLSRMCSVLLAEFIANHKTTILYINSLCMGIYIYQEFILKLIYYKTEFVSYIPSMLLPWIAFMVTLLLSALLTALTIKSNYLKYLIG